MEQVVYSRSYREISPNQETWVDWSKYLRSKVVHPSRFPASHLSGTEPVFFAFLKNTLNSTSACSYSTWCRGSLYLSSCTMVVSVYSHHYLHFEYFTTNHYLIWYKLILHVMGQFSTFTVKLTVLPACFVRCKCWCKYLYGVLCTRLNKTICNFLLPQLCILHFISVV